MTMSSLIMCSDWDSNIKAPSKQVLTKELQNPDHVTMTNENIAVKLQSFLTKKFLV